jgi:AcrR family transcriptional regulator
MGLKSKKAARRVRPGPVSALEASRRDRLIIKVATAEFLAKGYEGATIDAIALKCRISKTTIYSLFGNKEALFSHIATASISRYRYTLEHALDPARPFKEVIRNVVELMVEATHVKSANEILRLAVAERERFPSIGRMMLDHSFELVRPLGAYLASVARKGSLARASPCSLPTTSWSWPAAATAASSSGRTRSIATARSGFAW